MAKDFIKLIPIETFNSASITGTFAVVAADGLPYACFELRITNASDKLVEVSFDNAANTNEVVPANSSIVLSGERNRQPNNEKCFYQKGQLIYLKGTAGTGTIYISGYYQI